MIFALFVLFHLTFSPCQMLSAQTPPATRPPLKPRLRLKRRRKPRLVAATPAPATKPSETESVPTAWAPALDRVPDADRQNVLEALKLAGIHASGTDKSTFTNVDAFPPASLSASRTF